MSNFQSEGTERRNVRIAKLCLANYVREIRTRMFENEQGYALASTTFNSHNSSHSSSTVLHPSTSSGSTYSGDSSSLEPSLELSISKPSSRAPGLSCIILMRPRLESWHLMTIQEGGFVNPNACQGIQEDGSSVCLDGGWIFRGNCRSCMEPPSSLFMSTGGLFSNHLATSTVAVNLIGGSHDSWRQRVLELLCQIKARR